MFLLFYMDLSFAFVNWRNKQWLSVLSTVFEHDRVVSSTQKNFRAQNAVECSHVFLSAGNNPGVLKNSTEHAEPLFIGFRQFPFPQMT